MTFNNINNQTDDELTDFDDLQTSEEDFMADDDPFGEAEIQRLAENERLRQEVDAGSDITEPEGIDDSTTPESDAEQVDEENAEPREQDKAIEKKKAQLEQGFEVDGPFKASLLQRIGNNKKALYGAAAVGVVVMAISIASFTLTANYDAPGEDAFASNSWGDDDWGGDAWSASDDDWGGDAWSASDDDWGGDAWSASDDDWSADPQESEQYSSKPPIEPRIANNESTNHYGHERSDEDQSLIDELRRESRMHREHVSELEQMVLEQSRQIQSLQREINAVNSSASEVVELKQQLQAANDQLDNQVERIAQLERRIEQSSPQEQSTQSVVSDERDRTRRDSSAQQQRQQGRVTGDNLDVISAVEGFGLYRRISDGHRFELEEGESLRGWGLVERITPSGCIHVGGSQIEPTNGECR